MFANSGSLGLRIQASAHEHQFLRQGSELRVQRNGQRQVGHGAALVNRHFVRIFVHHPHQEMRRVFIGWLGGWRPFRQRRHHEWFVPPALVPGALIRHLAVALLPQSCLLAGAHQRERRAFHNRDIRAAHDLEQPQRVRHFLIAPLVAETTVIPSTSTCGD